MAVPAGEAVAQPEMPPRGEVVAQIQDGYARLAFTFSKPVEFERSLANGVLVLTLKSGVDIDLSSLARAVPTYIVAARSDPGGTSLRIALAQRLTVSVLPAAERVFVDLLPQDWQGPPPELPEAVVVELSKRAEEIERAKRRARNGVSTLSSVPLVLRVGRYPTFSRIVFEWNDAVKTILSRSGNKVKIKFNRPGEVDLTRLNVDPPPNIRGASMQTEDGRTEVEIEVAVGADVRGFRENTSYVLDISSDDGLGLEEIDVVAAGRTASALPPAPTGDEEIRLAGDVAPTMAKTDAVNPGTGIGKTAGAPDPIVSAPAPSRVANGDPKPDELPPSRGDMEISVTPLILTENIPTSMPPPGDAPAAAPVQTAVNSSPAQMPEVPSQRDVRQQMSSGLASTEPQERAQMAQSEELASIEAPEDMSDSKPDTMQSELVPGSIFEDTDKIDPAMVALQGAEMKAKPKVGAKLVGKTLRITLPFGAPVAGAVFQRAQTIWMVFDTDAALDYDAIAKEGADRVDSVSVVVSGRMQVIRLKLNRRFLVTANPQQRNWVVSVGDLVLDPTSPVVLERALRTDGRSKVVANLPDNGNVHWISDSDVGDQLAVVTAFGPARGMIKRQGFVEFTALPTAHGLVIKPIADDLAVRIAFSDVVITRDGGLTVSAARTRGYIPGQKGTGDGTRPGFINFEDWQQGGRAAYRDQVRRLQSTISTTEPDRRAGVRLELARLYLAHRLGAEALGVLSQGVAEDPEVENDPVFRAMRGVANIFMNHLEDAAADLSVRGLEDDIHSTLWRGMVAAGQGNWRQAQLLFDEGQMALDAYPAGWQSIFRLAAARSALMTNDLESASRHIDALLNSDLGDSDQQKVDLLQALLARALGKTDDALILFTRIENGKWGQGAAEAKFNRVSLAVRNKIIPVDEAIEILETLAISWRGDDVELSVMKKLAELQIEAGNFQRGLGVMREAVISRSGEERTRQINEDMTQVFEGLFLGGGDEDMKPLRALALYYEFRELTPVGRRGDEMIRKLVRRLIEVDLLGQAADLLSHQVDNRLIGVARAQVASDLALVYLMNRKPELALRSIRRTRQSVLPVSLKQKRNTLEARALAELGRVDIAVELLDTMQGADIEELKADAYWRGKRWQDAGIQIEKTLGETWQGEASLTDMERLKVMRAGISFSLANDRIGTDRLRRKFIAKMASSPDAVNFDVVTKVGQGKGIAFNTLAAEIAEIDTLSTFLEIFRKQYGQVGDQTPEVSSDAGASTEAQNG